MIEAPAGLYGYGNHNYVMAGKHPTLGGLVILQLLTGPNAGRSQRQPGWWCFSNSYELLNVYELVATLPREAPHD